MTIHPSTLKSECAPGSLWQDFDVLPKNIPLPLFQVVAPSIDHQVNPRDLRGKHQSQKCAKWNADKHSYNSPTIVMIASSSPFFDMLLVVLGGLLAGVIGILASEHGRRRHARDQFLSDIGRIMTIQKDTKFHALSAEVLRDSLWQVRPYINAKRFSECLGILREYESINYYEMAEHKEAAFVWSRSNNGKTIDDRLSEYIDRFAKGIK